MFLIDTQGIATDDEQRTQKKEFRAKRGVIRAAIKNSSDKEIGVEMEIRSLATKQDEFVLSIPRTQNFTPGRYKLIVALDNGRQRQEITQDFNWGVLTLNLDKSTYKPQETVSLGMAVLDNYGHTLCDATTVLDITDPSGQTTKLSTEDNTIAISDTCKDKEVTNKPDYLATYTAKEVGTYVIKLMAITDNGPRYIQETFDVTETAPYVVERYETANRIYPPSDYTVKLRVTANKAINGGINELVPRQFEIKNISNSGSISKKDSNGQTIFWPAQLEAGETVELSYTYKAPDISPEFYLLGPLELIQPSLHTEGSEAGQISDQVIYTEPRPWGIAADAVSNEGILYYGDTDNNGVMKFKTLTPELNFGAEVSTGLSVTTGRISFIVSKAAPSRDEIMIGHLNLDGSFNVMKCTKGADSSVCDDAADYSNQWNNLGTTPSMTCDGTEADCTRAFDVDYEQLSGRAMVVYADNTNQKLYYCYYDGTSWGPVSDCAPTNGSNDITLSSNGRPNFVSIKAKPNSNEILVATSVDVAGTLEIDAVVWDGSSWGSVTNITSTSNASALALEKGSAVDASWETLSGDAQVFWGVAGGDTAYRVRSSGSWGAETAGPSTGSASVSGLNLVRDPNSNRLAFIVNDSTSDANMGVWKADGTTAGWTTGSEHPTLENQEVGPEYTDVIWQQLPDGSGNSVAVFAMQAAANAPDPIYRTATCNGSGCTFSAIDSSMATCAGDDALSNRIFRSPNNNSVMLLFTDIDRNLHAQQWNGSAWQGAAACSLEVNVSGTTSDNTIFNSRPFTFEYMPYAAWQRNWRFFDDESSNDPSTGLNGAAENTTATEVDQEEIVRLRVNVAELGGQSQTDARKKLQYTTGCTPNSNEFACSWTDVGDTSETSAVWRYATSGETCASCTDNTAIATARLTGTNSNGWYTADKDAAAGTNMDHSGFTIKELDFPLKAEAVTEGTTYYFRLYDVDQGSSVLREQDNDGSNDCASATCTYPSLTIAAIDFTQNEYRWYENADSVQPGTALANENTAALSAAGPSRLRMNLTATEGLGASSQQFKLQYSTSTSGPWTSVTEWCNTTSPDCNGSWSSRKKITFNNAASSENLTDFPVLVSLSASNIDYSKTQNSGQDIRFTDSDGTKLYYEIESWNESGTSYVWVKVPQIDAGSTSDYIYIYYNNASATDAQNATNVWDGNHQLVWHMKETSGTTIDDATTNSKDGTKKSSTEPAVSSSGQINGTQDFDGTDDYVTNSSPGLPTTDFSYEAWVNFDSTAAGTLFESRDTVGDQELSIGLNGTSRLVIFLENNIRLTTDATVSTGTWYHIVVTRSSGALKFYINGDADTASATYSTTLNFDSCPLHLGVRSSSICATASNNAPLNGRIDEARISTSARSSSWIKAQYLSMSGSLNTVSSEELKSSLPWKFKDNTTPADGADISSNVLTSSDVRGSYEEFNPTVTNARSATAGQDIEWDFALDSSDATLDTAYYFRLIKNNDTALTSYTRYPQITIKTMITISGNVYEDEATTALVACDGSTAMISIRVDSTTYGPTACNDATGAFSISNIIQPPSNIITTWIDGATCGGDATTGSCASISYLYSGTGNITDMVLRKSRYILRDEDDGSILQINLGAYDNDDDTDIVFTSNDDGSGSGANFTTEDNIKLIIGSGTFMNLGTVTTSPSNSSTGTDGDILVESGATFNALDDPVSIGGDFTNSGTFSHSAGQVTTFTATSSGHTIEDGTSNFKSVTFNGSGGGWSFSSAVTIAEDLTLTAGQLTGTNDITLNGSASGAGSIILTGGTFEQRATSAAETIGTTSGSNNWTFNNLTLSNGTAAAAQGSAVKINDASNFGNLSEGHQLVKTSSGTLYAILNKSNTIEAWKSSNGSSWTEVGTGPTANSSPDVAAAIDGNDLIHIIYGTAGVGGGVDVSYVTFNTGTDSFGSSEVAIDTSTSESVIGGMDVALDSNNKPHITGLVFDITSVVTYANKTGASWSTAVNAFSGSYTRSNIVINEDTIPEIAGMAGGSTVVALGNQNNASSFTTHNLDLTLSAAASGIAIDVDASGNTWVLATDETGADDYISLYKHNDADGWTTWQSPIHNSIAGTQADMAIDGNVIHIIYEQTSTDDIAHVSYDGSSWSGTGTVLDTGTYSQAKMNTNNFNGEFDYLFTDGTDVYWNAATASVAVTVSTNSGGNGMLIVSGTATIGSASDAATTTFDMNTNDRTLDVDGALNITSQGVFLATSANSTIVGDDWTNAGTFTHNNGTVTFDSGTTASVGGGPTTFYNWTIDPGGVAKEIQFSTTGTHIIHVTNTFTVTGASGNLVKLYSNSAGNKWHFHPTGTASVTYADVKDGGCESGAITISPTNSTDSGNNDACWNFVTEITISGNAYEDDATTALVACDGSTTYVKMRISGTDYGPASCADANGAFSFSSVTPPAAGTPILIYLVDSVNFTEYGASVTRYSGSGNLTTAIVRKNRVVVRHDDAGPITNSDLSGFDGDDDASIPFTSNSGALSVNAGFKLLINGSDTFTPGGSVTIITDGTQAGPGGDLQQLDSSTLSMGTHTLSIGGDYTIGTSTTKSLSDGQTTAFTGTGSDYTIDGSLWKNIELSSSSGSWSFTSASIIQENLYVDGTLTGTNNISARGSVRGSGTINLTGGQFLAEPIISGQTFGSTSGSNNWTFNDLAVRGLAITSSSGSTAYHDPQSTADDNSTGSATWSSTANATRKDGNYVTASLNNSQSHYLKISDLGLALPSNVTVTGIVIEVDKGRNQFSNPVYDNAVRIVKGGTIGSTDKSTLTDWGTTGSYDSYGGSSDLWGETWSPSDINSSDFGFVISAKETAGGAATAAIDHIRVKVYFSTPDWLTTYTASAGGTGSIIVNNHLYIGDFDYAYTTLDLDTYDRIVDINGDITVAAEGTLVASTSASLTVAGDWNNNGTFTPNASNVTFDGTAAQAITGTANFFTMTIANTGASGATDDINPASNINIDGHLNINDGDLDMSASNVDLNVKWTMTIGTNGAFTKGTGTLTFDENFATTYTDNTAATQNLGAVSLSKNSGNILSDVLTIESNMTVDTLTIAADNTFQSNVYDYVLTIANTGATSTVLTNNGTFSAGQSVTKFTATNSGGNVTIPALAYSSLQLSGSETYDLGGSLTSGSAMTGSLTIDSGATLDVTTNNYDMTIAKNWSNSGTFTPRSGTVTFNTSSTSQISGATTFNNFTSTTAGKTIQFQSHSGGAPVFTVAGTFTITGESGNNIRIDAITDTTQWKAHFNSAQSSVTYATIEDSGCDTGTADVTLDATSTNDGNNDTCWVFPAAGSTFEQADYRIATTGSDSVTIDYTGAPAENTAATLTSTGQDFRLRQLIHVGNATLTSSGETFKLQFGEKAAAGCGATTFGDVATGSGAIRFLNNTTPADGADIANVTGDPDHSGHTRSYQDYEESNNFTNSVSAINAGEDGVWDFSLENYSSVGSKRYCFRVVKSDGTPIDTYTNYPEVIIDEELTFSLDATTKNFGTITPGAAPTDATSTLTTTTNAASGYQITLFGTQLLTRGAFTIPNWSGTNGTPTTFSGAGDSRFGYSTNDSDLGGGTADRFTSASNLFAGFSLSTPGDIVADNTSTPVSGEQFTVTYRLRTDAAQASGTYDTTLIYINTANY